MPLEPQWRDLIKVFIITIIIGAIIGAINYSLMWGGAWMAWGLIGWLYLIPTLVFLILIYKWAKKYKYI